MFTLTDEIEFPSPHLAEEDGLLAVGGDLSVERLTLAYSMGIFPWYSPGSPILWWSTDPRLVLLPDKLNVSRSLRQTISRQTYTHTMDRDFEAVIRMCARVHDRSKGGTWITPEMQEAYIEMHKCGLAHSVESWKGDKLAGGLYGVAIGGAFFGESMFATASDASKAAFVFLVEKLQSWGFTLIDCQMTTEHMMRFGAEEVPREEFMLLLRKALAEDTGPAGSWKNRDKPDMPDMERKGP
ncbi:MAG: leucyl/phenylalanyl-tRNA--protein transferase [Thermodesulfovibrionales bacterium]|nr:leucyl/phenylalanyl-tRNA--protein transferase [Thermodesulfovibrionales bacterium]